MSSIRRARIGLLTSNSLCHNPRVMKAADALARAGHEVVVFGAWLDPAFKARDQRLIESSPFTFTPVLDLTLHGLRAEATRFVERARRKSAQLAYGLTGRPSPLQLGLGVRRLVDAAARQNADLYIAHSEPGLYAARELLRRGCRVGADIEDWFSEDLLPQARRHRPLALLRSLERELLTDGAYGSCPSYAMSAALAREHQCDEPAVIYNAFAWADRQALGETLIDRRDKDIPSIHWFSTTVGPGRGLEDLVAALPLLKCDVEIHLRGNPAPGFDEWIRTSLPDRWRHKVFFHPLVPNDRLLAHIAEHDVGFAGEMKYCRSRDLTVTNKILYYLMAGLAVVASDTAGQREVAAAAPEAVLVYPSGDAAALAETLNTLLASREWLQEAKAAALAAAHATFCWERQEGTLLDAVARALARPLAVA